MADSEDLGLGSEDQIDSLDDANGINDDALLNDGADGDGPSGDDPELEAIKARVREMEEEAEKLKQLQNEVDKQMNMGSPPGLSKFLFFFYYSTIFFFCNRLILVFPCLSLSLCLASPLNMSLEEKMEVDNRSIYVGNVDYGATAEELEQHFHGCGSINRVTILCNKFDGHPKGFAYIEFGERDSVQTAMAMDESLFRGRQIKVRC